MLRERAAECEQLRRVPDDVVRDFRKAGFFRILEPARFGGLELDYGLAQIAMSELGRGCGSSSWVQAVVASHGWLLGRFPIEAQEAVWGEDPDATMSTASSTADGQIQEAPGGFILDGQWSFSSGIDACQWVMINAARLSPDGGRASNRRCIVPMERVEIVDDWYSAGLRGTGSKSVRLRNVFVPEEHTTVDAGSGNDVPGARVNPAYLYRLPVLPYLMYNIAGPALGIARGALDAFVEHCAERPQRGQSQSQQLRYAESAAEVDAAEALLVQGALAIREQMLAAGSVEAELEARTHRDLGYAGVLCRQAVSRLATAVGAHAVGDGHPILRALRDIFVATNHIGLNWDLAAGVYARQTLRTSKPPDPGA
jgi:3-hydroxy-9,10-secoandrosta-1,3,5(10)-triene-9,17-dione monooxygenase